MTNNPSTDIGRAGHPDQSVPPKEPPRCPQASPGQERQTPPGQAADKGLLRAGPPQLRAEGLAPASGLRAGLRHPPSHRAPLRRAPALSADRHRRSHAPQAQRTETAAKPPQATRPRRDAEPHSPPWRARAGCSSRASAIALPALAALCRAVPRRRRRLRAPSRLRRPAGRAGPARAQPGARARPRLGTAHALSPPVASPSPSP